MRYFGYGNVKLTDGLLARRQRLNRDVTMRAVYERFAESGRFAAFGCDWRQGQPGKPHIFWDSDVAKWMEAAAYILKDARDPFLEEKVEGVIDMIERNRRPDGYFNSYYLTVEPSSRFTDRSRHELYCCGHLIEAAVAYAEATGRTRFLSLTEDYAELVRRVFAEEKSAAFTTPGHEEIELALIRLYRFTGKRKYLDLATFFLDQRGANEPDRIAEGPREVPGKPPKNYDYNQSHLPVRRQTEARGHAVRAVYLYSAMADAALETCDAELAAACDALFEDITERKMYVTGGIGSTNIGEAFTVPYDLPNAEAYTETCAAVGLCFFAARMAALRDSGKYADVVERALYNGIMSGLSLDGKGFFYENPLEITLSEHFSSDRGARRFPLTQRPELFSCSCCPPNINRFLASAGGYIFRDGGDTLIIDQYCGSVLDAGERGCLVDTDYPRTGRIVIRPRGFARVRLRIPGWCRSFTLSRGYEMKNGYAETDGAGEIILELDMTPFPVRADGRVTRDAGRFCVERGPVVYCAERVDNRFDLASVILPADFEAGETPDPLTGLPALDVTAESEEPEEDGPLYCDARRSPPRKRPVTLRMIPYFAFANRGESDMRVWFRAGN
ncbi:MAG: glycoside hydrolase family 127 protein [Clostridia bacterium]|nr:glycoside hydrolase family 127 protein [Clostridia bacterium]